MSKLEERENRRKQSIISSMVSELEAAPQGAEKPTGKGRPKVDREIKKRVSLAVFPSSYEDLQKIAYVDRQSVSDIVSELIAGYVEQNAAKLKEYEKIKGE